MYSNFEMVGDFMEKFGQEVKTEPEFPDNETIILRLELIQEELSELREAIGNADIVEVADALTDILYVTYGAGHAFGIDLDECFEEVQASNMSKACRNEEEAQATVERRSAEQNEPCHYEKVGDYYIVYRTRDKKVMKNINYFRPDLKQFF